MSPLARRLKALGPAPLPPSREVKFPAPSGGPRTARRPGQVLLCSPGRRPLDTNFCWPSGAALRRGRRQRVTPGRVRPGLSTRRAACAPAADGPLPALVVQRRLSARRSSASLNGPGTCGCHLKPSIRWSIMRSQLIHKNVCILYTRTPKRDTSPKKRIACEHPQCKKGMVAIFTEINYSRCVFRTTNLLASTSTRPYGTDDL